MHPIFFQPIHRPFFEIWPKKINVMNDKFTPGYGNVHRQLDNVTLVDGCVLTVVLALKHLFALLIDNPLLLAALIRQYQG